MHNAASVVGSTAVQLRILLGLPEARILSFTDEGIHPIRYEDTESYQITKLFLEQRESLLNKLFNGAED